MTPRGDAMPGRCCTGNALRPGHHDLDCNGGVVDALVQMHQGRPPPPYVPSSAPPPGYEPPRGTMPGDLERMPSGHTRHCEARMKWGDGECECGAAGAGSPAGVAAPDAAEPAPNSPEDLGFTNSQTREPEASPPPAEHQPQRCRSCGAAIWWTRNMTTGRPMPVDAEPVEGGNVVLYRRGNTAISRVLKKGEQPGPGEKTRMPHHATCIHRDHWHAAAKSRKKR